MKKKIIGVIILSFFMVSCGTSTSPSNSKDTFLNPVPLDSDSVKKDPVEIDPCDSVTVQSGVSGWCACHPDCCQSQQWFCPPVFGEPTYYKKEVIVDICNEDNTPCLYGQDLGCSPPEILYMGECEEAYECPPASSNLDYGWQWCELPNGLVGKQHVTCDKGQLLYTPCQPCDPEVCNGLDDDCDGVIDEDLGPSLCETLCGAGTSICVLGEEVCFGPEPQEEICDYLDNDCDGETDENQLNVCNECGLVPFEVCDGWDNNCNGEIDEDLVAACSTACGTGIEVCSNGLWSGCTAQQPSAEICDGLDNDCNGQIDDGIDCLCTIQDVGSLFPCSESPLLCGLGYKTCECLDPGCLEIITTECYAACHWLSDPPGSDILCNPLVGMPLQDEMCNNFDDNCNQLIDEDLLVGCYSGPEGTLNIGICLPGTMTCKEGTWGSEDLQSMFIPGLCIDEVIPKDEECNGIDDDCDGIIDWGEEIPDTDILFIVDWSGSMHDEIDAVLIALNQFAAHYSLEDKLQWGLIVGPRNTQNSYEERLFMISDISPFPVFLSDFAGLGSQGMQTGNEMLLDALYLSLQNISGNAPIDMSVSQWESGVGESVPPKDQFNMSWRPGADRVIIVFSDEFPQSYMNPDITVTNVTDACQSAPQTKIYTFSTQLMWMWDEISDACGGAYFPLSNNSLEIYNSLMQILDEICMAPNDSPAP